MTFREVVEDLLGVPHKVEVPTVKYPETAQDGGHAVTPPNADPAYFKPEYPGMKEYKVPPGVEHPDHEWLDATKQGKFIPYIGDEGHGMAIDVDPSAIPVNDIDLIATRGHAFGRPVGAPHEKPVPVVIIDTPSFFGIEKRFSTNQFTLATGTAQLICSRRPERTLIRLSGTAAFMVAHSIEQAGGLLGFTVPANTILTLNVNQPVYAIATTGTPTISIYEEYTVVEGAKRF